MTAHTHPLRRDGVRTAHTEAASTQKPQATARGVVCNSHHAKNGLAVNATASVIDVSGCRGSRLRMKAHAPKGEPENGEPPLPRLRVPDVHHHERPQVRSKQDRPVDPRQILRDRRVHSSGECSAQRGEPLLEL